MKARFIFNPRSGHNLRNPYLLERTRAFIADQRLHATVVLTERSRHATELAAEAIRDGCELIVAIGGDGTMNEVASALVGSEAILGLIPCGSGNGLGRHLGIPGPGRGAFRTLLRGEARLIDTGMANGHAFFNAMGLGFDAEISHRFNRLTRRGLSSYVTTALHALLRFRPQVYTITDGQTRLQTRAFIISVANSDQYGNDCYIAPGAEIDDGRLDVTVLRNVDVMNAVPLAIRLFTKSISGSGSVARMRGSHFVIERGSPGLIHTDGETHLADEKIEVVVAPRSLRVMVPARSPGVSDVSVTFKRAR